MNIGKHGDLCRRCWSADVYQMRGVRALGKYPADKANMYSANAPSGYSFCHRTLRLALAPPLSGCAPGPICSRRRIESH